MPFRMWNHGLLTVSKQGHQQDAEEFLGWLLQALDDECSKAMDASPAGAPAKDEASVPTSPSDKGDASDVWMEVGRRQKPAITRSSGSTSSSPISKIFGGLLRSELRVPGLKPSITTEPYQPLQLDIGSPAIRNIIDAMKGLTSQEKLHGDFNTARGKNVEASKQVLIDELPPVLILHLKRFHFEAEGGISKISKKIGYPLELDIPKEVLSRQKVASLGSNMPRYRLFAVVYHHGKNASVGHYTVDVRRQDGSQWVRFDDTKIEAIRAEDVARRGAEEEPAKDGRKDGTGSGTSANRFGAMHEDDTGDDDGWKQVPSATNGNKWWSSVVNGNTKASARSKPMQESINDRTVAYILFYQRI
jgi:ubiquitin carboxyl-terminal hydrolase 10